MAYTDSHESYTYDSQDAYNTQPVRYIGYGNAPTITQQAPAPVKQVQHVPQPQANKVMKRSKAESLALVSTLKKWIIAASVVSFGTLSFLVAGNVVGVTSHTSTTSGSSATSTSSKSSTTITTPAQSSTNSNSGSYFQQGQNQQSTTQSNQGGYGIGNSSSSSQQGAVSSSSAS